MNDADTIASGEVGAVEPGDEAVRAVAIIGLAGRFPSAPDIEAFWRNLESGVCSVSRFTADELEAAGVDPAWLEHPNFVNARAVVEDVEYFDAGFFGLTPMEAELTDPQQRLFLECAWTALEQAACDPARFDGLIGVYAGVDTNGYAVANFLRGGGSAHSLIGNDKDYVATRAAFKLNLRGPAVTVQTACSTSLVAVQLACESLLGYQCDVALAGGAGIAFPQKAGYWYEEGGIMSPVGQCRAFDADAHGTVGGDGVGVVVLKRLEDAIADDDHIHAVILGAAINNDGAVKVGFTAPSIEGQAQVIAMAHAAAGVEADSISYVEAHGTGTELGDPIEIEALSEAFGAGTVRKQFCAIGSLKTNVGHMNSAAGVGALIKTVLALEHEQLPPSLNFESPNPRIDFENSPFFVNDRLREWPRGGTPRRAAVSSFGIGGTNAHLVLEEAPTRPAGGPTKPEHVLLLSAKTEGALDAMTERLAMHLECQPGLEIADVAYSLAVGRQQLKLRRAVVVEGGANATAALRNAIGRPPTVHSGTSTDVVFMLPGQGAQYVGMGRSVYESEPVARGIIDEGAELLHDQLGFDLRDVVFAPDVEREAAVDRLCDTALTQPALFLIEYALAQTLMAHGVRPVAMIGHSVGEYVAACIAEVFTFEDALRLLAVRGRLVQSLPGGAMLAVSLDESSASAFTNVCVAAVNAPGACVLAGDESAIAAVERELAARDIACKRLATSHAFHSAMMEPVLEPFVEQFATVRLNEPTIPYASNVTGRWVTEAEATDPRYWAKHIRSPVRFEDGLAQIAREGDRLLVEVGPGRSLCTAASRTNGTVHPSVVTLGSGGAEKGAWVRALGWLDCHGAPVDWSARHRDEGRRKVVLPTYPFERERYWLDPGDAHPGQTGLDKKPDGRTGAARWLYFPYWKPKPVAATSEGGPREPTVLFTDGSALGSALEAMPGFADTCSFTVAPGHEYKSLGAKAYRLDERSAMDYERLVEAWVEACADAPDRFPRQIVHLWGAELALQSVAGADDLQERFELAQYRSFYSLLFLVQALSKFRSSAELRILVVTAGALAAPGTGPWHSELSTVQGLVRGVRLEIPELDVRVLDLDPGAATSEHLRCLARETRAPGDDLLVGWRAGSRWVEAYDPVDGEPSGEARVRQGGAYVMFGGLGRIGLTIAAHLAERYRARLVLVGRAGLPPRSRWDAYLQAHSVNDKTARRIRRVRELEQQGAEIIVTSGDVADAQELRRVFSECEHRFGTVDGVFHCAGVVEGALLEPMVSTDVALCRLHFSAKAHGLHALAATLPDSATLCVVCSSLSAVLGLTGGIAYTAASCHSDAFVHERVMGGDNRWICVDWDGWKPPAEFANESTDGGDGVPLFEGIGSEQGIEVLERVLGLDSTSRIVVSTHDLASRFEALEQFHHRGRHKQAAGGQRHARPDLETAFAPPTDPVQAQLATLWQEVLGIEAIGINDDFFLLGGDSLVAIKLASRIRDRFGIAFSVHNLFDAPTVADQARKLDDLIEASKVQLDRLVDQLDLVESLSEDQVREMLATLDPDSDESQMRR